MLLSSLSCISVILKSIQSSSSPLTLKLSRLLCLHFSIISPSTSIIKAFLFIQSSIFLLHSVFFFFPVHSVVFFFSVHSVFFLFFSCASGSHKSSSMTNLPFLLRMCARLSFCVSISLCTYFCVSVCHYPSRLHPKTQ